MAEADGIPGQVFASVWDALEDSPAEAANMNIRPRLAGPRWPMTQPRLARPRNRAVSLPELGMRRGLPWAPKS
jgi:hypothetical protein